MRRNFKDPAYEDFRKKIRARDKNRCRMPGCKSRKKLQVHHIRTWSQASSLRYEISNGITLCEECHKSIRGKECHYESLFIEIINDL